MCGEGVESVRDVERRGYPEVWNEEVARAVCVFADS